ncbi:MAG: Ldh family oxidoreductase [Rhodobacteraceae bacterium]|jgi:(2R)-3-sulfolactate dehydrogenase (NADP+)|nr:Ldh family oxidoreductase [Paracoccaceae bacterium]
MMSRTLAVAAAHDLAVAALVASGTAPANAASVAAALTGAELAGQAGHGLRRLPAYAAQVRTGKVDGRAVATASHPRPALAAIDAGHGFAYPALDLAVAELLRLAPRHGVAAAGIRRSHHAGVAGLFVERLAGAGLVGLMFANTPGAMAAWGGSRPLFGTDPIAFACPVAGGAPVVVDVSLSRVARGKVMAAAQQGAPIPEGWALDAAGRPTTDAAAALAGTMLPMGDAKGTALALMVEMLAAGLTGANFAAEQSSFFDAKGPPPGTGQLLVAFDARAFDAAAPDRFAALAAAVEADPPARLPGRRRQAHASRIAAEGIAVDEALLAEIEAIARGRAP